MIALIDIGSGSVGGALVEVGAGKPAFVMHRRIALPISRGRSAHLLQSQIMAAADSIAADLRAHAGRRAPHRTAVFLPAPWSELSLSRLRFSEEKEFSVNASLVHRLVGAHVKHEERGEKEPGGEEVFERVIAGIRLNGYASPAMPETESVLHMELMLAASRAPAGFLKELTRSVARHLPQAEISFHSTALGAAHALSRLSPDTQSFLLCDGEGELAELVLVNETIPEAHATIPVGYATIIRTLAAHGGLTPAEIPSALALIANPRSPLAAHGAEAIELATRQCGEALGHAAPVCAVHAPSMCFLIGDGPEAAWFAGALEHSPRLRAVLPRDFAVRIVTAKSLAEEVAFGVRSRGDAMLGLQALFVADRFGSERVQPYYE